MRRFHVHGLPRFFVSRKLPAESRFRSASRIPLSLIQCGPQGPLMPVGFCCGGFPPPPVTFPATRLGESPKRCERLCTFGLITSRRRRPFPANSDPLRRADRSSSLSASAPSVLGSGFPLLLPASGVSRLPLHLSVPVKTPVSDLDCEAILHPQKPMSSRKYFNYTLILRASCEKSVEKRVGNLWTKMWKIREVRLR